MGTTMSWHPITLPPRIPCQSTNSVEGTSSGRWGLPLLHETSPILSSSDSSRVVVDLFALNGFARPALHLFSCTLAMQTSLLQVSELLTKHWKKGRKQSWNSNAPHPSTIEPTNFDVDPPPQQQQQQQQHVTMLVISGIPHLNINSLKQNGHSAPNQFFHWHLLAKLEFPPRSVSAPAWTRPGREKSRSRLNMPGKKVYLIC